MSRSIFEEVGENQSPGQRSGGQPPRSGEAARAADRRRVRIWMLVLAAMVVAQIAVGGLTRITDSGLSITDWSVMGSLPPFSEDAWLSVFAEYQQTPEFRLQNSAMTLDEFKTIYWWEWGHRSWGRLIGIVFLLPFAWFLYKRSIPNGWLVPIAVAGALGALQGVIGAWMVESGLQGERVDVSQHRLAVHKIVAYVILAILFWVAFSLKRDEVDLLQARRRREGGMYTVSRVAIAALGVQVVVGAYVSGMNAGIVYPEWPLMGGALYPPNEPFTPFVDLEDGKAATQFIHRIVAYLLVAGAIVYFWRARRSAYRKTRLWGAILLGVVAVQTLFGISTVISGVTAGWAFIHHFMAVVVFVAALHAAHQAAFPAEERIAR